MNCKPGDMAYLVKARLKENIGAIVSVIDRCDRCLEVCWHVKPAWPMRGYTDFGFIGTSSNETYCHCDDSVLRPIRPDADPVQVGQLEGLTERA